MLLPILIAILFAGGTLLFTLLLVLFAFLGLEEFYRMNAVEGGVARVAALTFGGLFPLVPPLFGFDTLLLCLTVAFLVTSSLLLFSFGEIAGTSRQITLLATGWLYVAIPLTLGGELRRLPDGREWILLMLAAVMLSDTAAFYVGTAVGRHRLYPAVSPKKSIEGSLAGLAGSVLGGVLVARFLFGSLPLPHAALAALLAGIAGQIGDLFESMLKRSVGIKDSGTLFPGHGGVLDRLDSILFAVPVLYLYARFTTGG